MSSTLLNRRDLDFLLYELLDTETLLDRPSYQDHSREVFNATLDTPTLFLKNILPITTPKATLTNLSLW